jgi:hypothetical protein
MRSLDFSIDQVLEASLWSRDELTRLQKWEHGIFLGGWPAPKANNLIAVCESIVYKMWEPRCLTALLARSSTACYRDGFTLFYKVLITDTTGNWRQSVRLCCGSVAIEISSNTPGRNVFRSLLIHEICRSCVCGSWFKPLEYLTLS